MHSLSNLDIFGFSSSVEHDVPISSPILVTNSQPLWLKRTRFILCTLPETVSHSTDIITIGGTGEGAEQNHLKLHLVCRTNDGYSTARLLHEK